MPPRSARSRPFLAAEWRDLVMLNYPIDPAVLLPRVPIGCELDVWNGQAFVSLVGFRFLNTRVLGLPIPFHRHFDEVNLRFYVRHRAEGEWRRGVVFVKELVPRRAIAWVARTLYGENYVALPMRHSKVTEGQGQTALSYAWRRGDEWESIAVRYSGTPEEAAEDSEERFITEHYWGYARRSPTTTVEYEVEHPRWRVWRADEARFTGDTTTLYGPEFVDALLGTPSTAFIANGSPVVVRQGRQLAEA